MRSIVPITILLLAVLISGCRKEGSTGQRVWEGRVLEYGSDEPVAGARVYLWEGTSEWWGQSSQYRIDSTESAADGTFRFRYERVGGRYYRITGSAEQYYAGEAFLERTSSTKADLVLDPYAWALLRITCTREKTESLTIQNDYCRHAFFGASLEEENELVCPKRGNNNGFVTVFYQPRISLGLPSETFDEKVFFPAHDTTVVEVRFE